MVPNLWGLAVGPPGLMKSPALAEALRPLSRLIGDAHAEYEEQMLAHHFRLAEAKAHRHDLTRRLRDAFANDEPTADLREHFEAAPAYRPPVAKRYLVNDTTVEKLGELLNHNPNGLLLFRDEVSGFLHTMDRPGHENDRAFYCEAWNGTGAYTYDRIGRGTLHIRAACVSVLGGIQPGPLERYLREVFGGRGDDGLIQRFQLAVWPDVAGRWQNVDRWPDAAARGRAIEVFQRLNRLEAATAGAEELTPEEVPFLRFDPAAQELFDGWRAELEQRLRAEDEHPVLLSHLAKYRSLMPALALILHVIDGVDAGGGGAVSGVAAERAAAWCQYLEAHARRLYATVTDRVRVAAALLASRMARGRLASPFTAPRGLPQRLDRADGAPRRGGGAGVPPGARLDSARGGRRPGRWSAHRAVPHQSSGGLSLRKPLRFCRFCRLESSSQYRESAAGRSDGGIHGHRKIIPKYSGNKPLKPQ